MRISDGTGDTSLIAGEAKKHHCKLVPDTIRFLPPNFRPLLPLLPNETAILAMILKPTPYQQISILTFAVTVGSKI